MADLLVRQVCPLLGAGSGHPPQRPVDVLVRDGRITAIGPGLARPSGVPVLEGGGAPVVPGLWDHHVHLTQWGLAKARLDTSGCADAAALVALVEHQVRADVQLPTGVLVGWGHRSARWARQPTVAALDAVTEGTGLPVVLISGDGHHAWLNTPAFTLLGAAPREGPVVEDEWFGLYGRLDVLPYAAVEAEAGVAVAVREAHTRGVTGIVDLEFTRAFEQWQQRYAAGIPALRVRAGVYPGRVGDVLERGWRTGDPLPGTGGLARMGPLKIITDGSLNTRTAWCCEPYADGDQLADPCGAANLDQKEMERLVTLARDNGLEVALHAIGDAAVSSIIGVLERTGASGSIEHAQLVREEDLPRWSRLGRRVAASVQPAHLLDDRVVTEHCWPERTGRSFAFGSLARAGIPVLLGSDAPVSPLDPWLAMACAVHRGPVGAESWHPEQQLSAPAALAASVDGRRTAVGEPGDLVLLAEHPFGPEAAPSSQQAARLREARVQATVVDGQVVHTAAS